MSSGCENLRACPVCGLVQQVPARAELPPRRAARCARCRAVVRHRRARPLALPAALSLAALIIYPLSMALPVLRIEQMGHEHSATIWSGVVQLINERHTVIGLIVFACSIVVPLLKIGGIFVLCAGNLMRRSRVPTFMSRRHHALTYRAIDWIGRWGMIDVLLVALLVAAVKLGDWMDVHPGPGIVAFAAVVVLSLLASAAFDPHSIWEEEA